MNFFGHSVVAGWFDDDPRFALGAMLPDFAAMCGGRIAKVHSPITRRGIDHHHQADAIFHQLPWFKQRMQRLSHQLRVAGVRRGPALGSAHVGIEIALDSALAGLGQSIEPFRAAISAADPDTIDWKDGATGARFSSLLQRLRAASPSADAHEVARRVRGTLSRRPRLALEEAEMPAIRDAMAAQLQELESSAEALLQAMRVRLAAG